MNCDTPMEVVDGLTPTDKDSTPLERLSRTDLGPLLIIFSLFITGFCLLTGGMLLIIFGGRLVLGVLLLGTVFEVVDKAKERWVSYSQEGGSRGSIWKERAKWMVVLRWWLPQEHRDAILGDILEDCHDMRESGLTKQQIRTHVLWQWVIAVVTLVPASVIHAIARLWRTPLDRRNRRRRTSE